MRGTLPAVLAMLFAHAAEATRVEVQGLFEGRALVAVDGQSRLLRVGERSPEGVLLVAASPRECVVEIDGHSQRLDLSRRIASSFSAPQRPEAAIHRDLRREYHTVATIGRQQVPVLVDTGATSVAMNEEVARRLGIDFRLRGIPTVAETASGHVRAWRVTLDEVSVAGVTVRNVEALVNEGGFPTETLLGMSYLSRVEMQERAGVLRLKALH